MSTHSRCPLKTEQEMIDLEVTCSLDASHSSDFDIAMNKARKLASCN